VRVILGNPRKFFDVAAVRVVVERRRNAAAPRPVQVLTLIGAGMVPSPRQGRGEDN